MASLWDQGTGALQQGWDNAEGVLSGDTSDLLASTVCTEAAVQAAQAVADIVSGVIAIYASGGTAASTMLPQVAEGSKTFMMGMLTELKSRANKYLWAAYTLVQAQQGSLIASAADVGSWYRVTHEGCGGGRSTLGSDQKKMARAIGLYLGSPAIVAANNLTENNLSSLFSTLNAQGMDGLQPLKSEILSGFKESTKGAGAATKTGGLLGGGFTKGAKGAAPSTAAPVEPKKALGWLAALGGALLFLR